MKKRYIFTIGAVCILLSILSFSYVYNLIMNDTNDNEDLEFSNEGIQGKLDNNLSNELPSTTTNKKRISPNTTIEYVIYFLECGHRERKITKASRALVNMDEKSFKSMIQKSHSDWSVVKFSPERTVIEIEKEQLCTNHYIIGVKGGKIAIFKINSEGEKVLDKVIESAPISILKPIDQQRLIKGIKVDSREEISDILENFIS